MFPYLCFPTLLRSWRLYIKSSFKFKKFFIGFFKFCFICRLIIHHPLRHLDFAKSIFLKIHFNLDVSEMIIIQVEGLVIKVCPL